MSRNEHRMRHFERIVVVFLFGFVAVVAVLAISVVSWVRSQDAPHRLVRDRLSQLASGEMTNPVELALVAGHDIDRICFGYEYTAVVDDAERYGIVVDVAVDARIPEASYGLFIIGPGGEVTYGALDSTEFVGPTRHRCHVGGRLALQFDSVDPLRGGRLVDLDAPDLQPTMIE